MTLTPAFVLVYEKSFLDNRDLHRKTEIYILKSFLHRFYFHQHQRYHKKIKIKSFFLNRVPIREAERPDNSANAHAAFRMEVRTEALQSYVLAGQTSRQ